MKVGDFGCLLLMLMIGEVTLLLGWSHATPAQISEDRHQLGDNHYRRSVYPSNSDHLTHEKRHSGNYGNDPLRTTLILVFTVGVILSLLVLVTVCAVCMLHRTRNGEFCCMKPKIQYRRSRLVIGSDRDTDNEEVDEDNPPQYDCSYLDRESPPVYTDALQDAVLAKGIDTSTITLPPYSPPMEHEDSVPITSPLFTQEEQCQNTSISGIEICPTEDSSHVESESCETETQDRIDGSKNIS